MKVFGLVGHPLTHSFSQKYFREKFINLNFSDCEYKLFDLPELSGIKELADQLPGLQGLNVTIPYKESIIPLLDDLDEIARGIGAVNAIKITNGVWKGFNTDYYGFKESLAPLIKEKSVKGLVLGTGGSSKAVRRVLHDFGIEFIVASRSPKNDQIGYEELRDKSLLRKYNLIINTTPLGMHPDTTSLPDLDYLELSSNHILFDLVYNPETTAFLAKGQKAGAMTKNGLEMLYIQADRSWDIWTGDLI